MNKNDKHLFKLWIPVLLIILIIIIAMYFSMKSNNYIFLIGIIFAIFVRQKLKKGLDKNLLKALKQEGPNELIFALVAPLKSTPNKNMKMAFTAYHTALPLVLYGNYSQAEEVMEKVDWTKQEPIYQALKFNINSLINYFNSNNFEGLSFARQAKALATTSSMFLGSNKSQSTYEAYIEIGQILNGLTNETIIKSLNDRFIKLPLIPKLIIAWGLQNAYKQINNMDKFEEMKLFCTKNAPYCNALFILN
jgi:hypothetical protein